MDPELEVVDDLIPLDAALDTAIEQANAGAEDDDADMMAGYSEAGGGVDGAKPAATVEGAVKNDTADLNDEEKPAQKAAAPAATSTPTPAPVKIGRWTEDEIAGRFAELETLKKGQSTVAGHIGDLRQRLQTQGARTITKDDLPTVVAEFGVEYAEALAADLNKLGGLGGASAGPSQKEIDDLVEQRSQQYAQVLEQRLEKKRVLRHHKDADEHFFTTADDGKTWTPGPKAEAFKAWVGQLPEDRQKVIATSWDSDVMIGALSEFKEHQKASASPAQPAGSPPAARQSRVERAVAPRGSGVSTTQPSEDDAMSAGYASVKGPKR